MTERDGNWVRDGRVRALGNDKSMLTTVAIPSRFLSLSPTRRTPSLTNKLTIHPRQSAAFFFYFIGVSGLDISIAFPPSSSRSRIPSLIVSFFPLPSDTRSFTLCFLGLSGLIADEKLRSLTTSIFHSAHRPSRMCMYYPFIAPPIRQHCN